MKIICENCATKYSIADEKVRGKAFKIRCKKCSHTIVVRGSTEALAAAPQASAPAEPAPHNQEFDRKETKVFDYSNMDATAQDKVGDALAETSGEPPTWHLVIDREQIGPVPASEVRQRFLRGEVDSETYLWRQGFADWPKLRAITEI